MILMIMLRLQLNNRGKIMYEKLTNNQKKILTKKFNSFSKNYSKEDINFVLQKSKNILAKAGKSVLENYKEYIGIFLSMVKDFFKGTYKVIPKGSIAAIVGTLLYIFLPIDVIPDVLPGIGLVDDAFIVSLALNFLKKDIDDYKKFIDDKNKLAIDLGKERNNEPIRQ